MDEVSGARRHALLCAVLAVLLWGPAVLAQQSPAASAKDPLGRDTPRGTVLGFMDAARAQSDEVAVQYLNTGLRGKAAIDLARKLFVVLDRRLPPRLNELSDRPEGSLANPLKPEQDVVGTIQTADGTLDLVVDRVTRGARPVWLFSRTTLETIPDVYDEVDLLPLDRILPNVLIHRRIGGIRLFAWLMLLVIVPAGYQLTGLLGRLLSPLITMWRRRRGYSGEPPANLLHGSVRLLLVAVLIRGLLGSIEIRLPERVFWSGIATMLTIGGIVWALLLLNEAAEESIYHRLQVGGRGERAAMLRLARRTADCLVMAAGALVALNYFGFNPTAALAGLGIGGIAVALAAQKTLENVIGGLSIIFDEAVRVGDFLKFGDAMGKVDYIGLRSTRIRTPDRTVLSVPNGQIANATIETLSARDKFWFHHFVGLRYETSAGQMRAIVEAIRAHLAGHPLIDRTETIRVRFFRLGPFSLDIEIAAYVHAGDLDAFLDTQQELLLEVMAIVERGGSEMALPSQTLHLARSR